MKLSFSATNPCHLYDLAKALHGLNALGRYYSGYPGWKLKPPAGFPLVARSARTLATYGCLRLPALVRPAPHRLFRWQDTGFDRATARALRQDPARMLHAMPGQALETFRAARAQGISTVLNHASGPVRQQLSLVEDEYRRAGVPMAAHHQFGPDYFRREDAEYAMADHHCVASTIVRDQLVQAGVSPERIWVVPYGADAEKFHPPAASNRRAPFRVVYAGQVSLRKGLRIAFSAIEHLRHTAPFTLDIYGGVSAEMRSTLAPLAGAAWLRLHGPVAQNELGHIFREASMLVLPSWEEAFGLVVVQALSCGLPCIVSDRVGAGDLIAHRRNGSIFPAGDTLALGREIEWWAQHVNGCEYTAHPWDFPARQLLELSRKALDS